MRTVWQAMSLDVTITKTDCVSKAILLSAIVQNLERYALTVVMIKKR